MRILLLLPSLAELREPFASQCVARCRKHRRAGEPREPDLVVVMQRSADPRQCHAQQRTLGPTSTRG